jgi:hypothetical protein
MPAFQLEFCPTIPIPHTLNQNPPQKSPLLFSPLCPLFVYFFGHRMLQHLLEAICGHGAGCFEVQASLPGI